uniref:Uncharacterized protein n=1 Tax=Meloidogyne enterolobii TaxID=390850 RepID=A0A6V7V8L1_MELEN|nr:unnamed protein product [Meloidogyne enterolobii]
MNYFACVLCNCIDHALFCGKSDRKVGYSTFCHFAGAIDFLPGSFHNLISARC